MKLHWSPRSPFVRKVMIVAHEAGVVDSIELVRTAVVMTKVNPDIMSDNPLGKIPTLVLDDGRSIFDSLIICRYLDSQGAGPSLFPAKGDAKWEALTRHSLGQGLTEALILWRNELNRVPEKQLGELLTSLQFKVTASLDLLETMAPKLEALPFDIGHAAIGCACGYLDFRFADFDWRVDRPALAAWHKSFEARPSAQATVAAEG